MTTPWRSSSVSVVYVVRLRIVFSKAALQKRGSIEPMEPLVDPQLHWNLPFQNPRSATAQAWRKCSLIRIVQKATPPKQCRRRGGGQQGQFAPGPHCKGAPKRCRTCSSKIRSSVTFRSSFFKGLVSLYFRQKSACSFALRFMLLTQIMHNYLTWLLRSPLARAPYVVLLDLKPLIKDGNLQVYM